MDVAAWLDALGLPQYAQAFTENGVDAEALLQLTPEDLKEIGVTAVGHRRKLVEAIAGLRDVASTPVGSPGARTAAHPRSEPERRQVTVMFCDLVGSTALALRLDPEEMREVLRAYERAVAAEVAQFEGHVAKFLGDGVLCYFGWPHAHEDEAERAVRAGLAVAQAVTALQTPTGETLEVRVGIATGLVVVGDLIGEGGAQEEAIVGDTPNLAARLQAVAGPGEVVIAESTRRLIGGLFNLSALVPLDLRGYAGPVGAYALRGEVRTESRFEALKGSRLMPLIGREQELRLLLRAWEDARQGHGRAVFISGEPGIGKSRLAQALVERASADRATVLRYFCSPYHAGTALYPIIEQFQRAASLESGDTVPDKLAKLEACIARAVKKPEQLVPLFASLLGIPEDGRYPPPNFTPAAFKARIFEAFLALLAGHAGCGPLLMLVEDLHWIDPTTAELLAATVAAVPHLAVLLLATARAEFRPAWAEDGRASAMPLARLSQAQSSALLRQLTKATPLPETVATDILGKTEGVPLFLEELTKAILETGALADVGGRYGLTRPLTTSQIPTTLQDSLMARLDRLGGPKTVAQVGAVIGRDFTYALVKPLADLPEQELHARLKALEEGDLVQRRGDPPVAVYSFKHALVRDAAYESLLKSRRQVLHERLVGVIESSFPQLTDSQPELLAHHCTGARLFVKATSYWRRAGEQAVRRAANREAIEHFRRALSLVAAHLETDERDRTELAILSQLGPALMSVHGWPAPEVGEAFERAEQVARRLQSSSDLAAPLVGLWLFRISRGQFDQAEEIFGELFRVAKELDDPELLLQAHHAAWPTHFLRGSPANAREHIEAGMALYDEARHERHRYLYLGHDPAVCALAIGATTRWLLGYPDRAACYEHEAIRLARRLRHAPSMAHALWFAGEAQVARGDATAAMTTACELLALCEEHKLPQPRATALMFLGWALARTGEVAEGARRLDEGLADWNRLGARSYLPRGLCLLAEVRLLERRYAEGLDEVTRALAIAAESGERWYVARMHQVRAKLLQQADHQNDEGHQASLQAAIEVARLQGAKGWELKAAISLARLWTTQGERRRAHALLAPVYDGFTEGIDTPDLCDARTLLASLR